MFRVGSLPLPAYILPMTSALVLLSLTNRRKTSIARAQAGSKILSKTESHNTNAERDTLGPGYIAPHIFAELTRIIAFAIPVAGFSCYVAFCSSCLSWRNVVYGFPATPPSLSIPGIFSGLFFFIVWAVMGIPKDHRRAHRDPWTTLQEETWFSARAAGWTLAALLAGWGALLGGRGMGML